MAWQLCLLIGLFGITFGAPDPYPGCVDSTKLNCTDVKHQVCTFKAAYHICPRTCNLCDRNPSYHPCKDHVQGIKCADLVNPCSDSVGLISCPKFCGICSSSTPTNPPPTSIKTTPFPVTAPTQAPTNPPPTSIKTTPFPVTAPTQAPTNPPPTFIKTTPFPVTAPTQAHSQLDDPCDPINHNELDDPWRSTGFMNAYPEEPHCDIHLIQGWYRFTSPAGGTMPTTPPSRQMCGTVVPVWINGTLPSVGDKVESRACANLNQGADECEHSFPIWVKNCGGYFVYYLRPIPTCHVAYCAGDKSPCPVGQWSASGYPPCKEAYPIMDYDPELSDPVTSSDGKSFRFDCTIHSTKLDPDQRFEVSWTFDSQEDPNIMPVVVSDPTRVVSLDGAYLQGHVNTMVGCHVRTFYTGGSGSHGQPSHVQYSNPYYAGIEVNTDGPNKLVVDGLDFSKNVSITSTIPIICTHNTSCCLMFKLDVDAASVISVQNSCDWQLCTSDWNSKTNSATIHVPVVANKDLINDGNKQLLLAFEPLLPAGGGAYHNVFLGHTPDKLPLEVIDGTSYSCHVYGDPHFDGFEEEKMYSNFFNSGDFTLCKIEEENFEVQIRTWACGHFSNRRASCICGAVIREGNDVIKIDQCDQNYGGRYTSPTVEIAGKLRNSTVVQRAHNGHTIAVYMPSGTELKVNYYNTRMTLHMITSELYADKCRGACGTNDGNQINEFTHPSGHVDSPCLASDSYTYDCRPMEFLESWRPSPDQSLFENIPAAVPQTDEVKFCACKDNHQGSPVINCTVREDLPTAGSLCHNCPDITSTLDPSGGMPIDWRRKRSAGLYTDVDVVDQQYRVANTPVDMNTTWPSANGMTETEARDVCLKVIQKSPLFSVCKDKGLMVDNLIEACTQDILLIGDTSFVASSTDTFTSMCQVKLVMDPASYVTNAKGKSVMKPQYIDDVCLPGCEDHGHCGAHGKCVCDAGWEGALCHLVEGQGPQLGGVRGGSLCDTQQRPCEKIFIDADNLDLSKDLTCRVQLYEEYERVDTPAVMISSRRLACALPKTEISSQKYTVSASNDNRVYGNSLQVQVYDSSCLTCDETGCTEKPTACNIDNRCYRDGQHHVTNHNLVCDVTHSITQWKDIQGQGSSPTLTGPNDDHIYTCAFTPNVDLTVTVTWLVNGVVTSSKTYGAGASEALINAWGLPTYGQLTCQVTVNGIKKSSAPITLHF